MGEEAEEGGRKCVMGVDSCSRFRKEDASSLEPPPFGNYSETTLSQMNQPNTL